MNKTVTINLSGIVFHIDENAFDKLRSYLDSLRRHFANTSGKDEIISDIEGRFAEMFSEKVSPGKNVITLPDVDDVINVMGKPEEVAASDEEEVSKGESRPTGNVYVESDRKRFFRNPDDKVLGGVCSGISAYFDIDPIWLRLAFVLAVFFGGTGILLYIILWIIIPIAATPTDKLQMRGERVTLANIQRSVQEEMESMKKKGLEFTREMGSEENRVRVRSTGQKVGDFIGDIFRAIFKFIAVIFGIIITIMSIGVLIALTVAIFSGIGVFTFVIPKTLTDMVLTEAQLWWLILGGLLAIGIPFTLLLLNGLKILFKVKLNLKMIGAVMAGLWILGLGICILTGISIAADYKDDAVVKNNRMINTPASTLIVKADNHWITDDERNVRWGEIEDLIVVGRNSDSIVAPFVRFDIESSESDSVYVVERSYSCGSTYAEARTLAEEIKYSYSVTDSVITLPNYFVIDQDSKYRGQMVRMILKLPVGKSVMLDKSLGWMLDDISNVTETWDGDMLGYKWTMTSEGLECENCPASITESRKHWEDDGGRIIVDPGQVIIEHDDNGNEVIRTEIRVDTLKQ